MINLGKEILEFRIKRAEKYIAKRDSKENTKWWKDITKEIKEIKESSMWDEDEEKDFENKYDCYKKKHQEKFECYNREYNNMCINKFKIIADLSMLSMKIDTINNGIIENDMSDKKIKEEIREIENFVRYFFYRNTEKPTMDC